MLRTMQSLPPAVFLTSHMVFVKLWEVKELCDGAVEDLPPRYRNEQTGRYYINRGAMSTPSNICLFLDCVMEHLGGRCFRIVLIIITHVFTISLGMVLSECTFLSRGGAIVGPWLHTCKPASPWVGTVFDWGCSRAMAMQDSVCSMAQNPQPWAA